MKTVIEIILAIYSVLGVLSSLAHIQEYRQVSPTAEQRFIAVTSLVLSLVILVISVVNLFL